MRLTDTVHEQQHGQYVVDYILCFRLNTLKRKQQYCLECGRPHTAHPVAKISQVKDLAPILLISVFSLSSLHLLSIRHQQYCFPKLLLLSHNCLMRCSFSVVNAIAVAALLLTLVFLHRC